MSIPIITVYGRVGVEQETRVNGPFTSLLRVRLCLYFYSVMGMQGNVKGANTHTHTHAHTHTQTQTHIHRHTYTDTDTHDQPHPLSMQGLAKPPINTRVTVRTNSQSQKFSTTSFSFWTALATW